MGKKDPEHLPRRLVYADNLQHRQRGEWCRESDDHKPLCGSGHGVAVLSRNRALLASAS